MDQINFALSRVRETFIPGGSREESILTRKGSTILTRQWKRCKRVFGIVGICPVMKVEEHGLEELGNEVIDYLAEVYQMEGKTFKVMTRRARKSYPVESMEVNAYLGGRILDAFPGASVDVHHPELMIHVEIRGKNL